MAYIDRVFNYLARRPASPGVTASRIASDTKVPRKTVMNRISDLRSEGHRIYSNRRQVNGREVLYYRMGQ
jgi:biotin operon repressor